MPDKPSKPVTIPIRGIVFRCPVCEDEREQFQRCEPGEVSFATTKGIAVTCPKCGTKLVIR